MGMVHIPEDAWPYLAIHGTIAATKETLWKCYKWVVYIGQTGDVPKI